jgi:monoterpene epsilon-lactone hydrolase
VAVNLFEMRSIAQWLNQLAARWLVFRRGTRLSLVSPVFADLSAFPRLLFQVGEQKILRSDSERLAEKARKAGIEVKIDFRKLL